MRVYGSRASSEPGSSKAGASSCKGAAGVVAGDDEDSDGEGDGDDEDDGRGEAGSSLSATVPEDAAGEAGGAALARADAGAPWADPRASRRPDTIPAETVFAAQFIFSPENCETVYITYRNY